MKSNPNTAPWREESSNFALDSSQIDLWVQEAEEDIEDAAAWGASSKSLDNFIWYQDSETQQESEQSSKLGEWLSPGSGIETAVNPQKAKSYKILPSKPNLHFRPEIEGLRSIAVLLIVVYHVWLGKVSGGVDVFLFISAFLLSSSFARRLDSGQKFAPVKYWLRTFTRIMPPAAITIILTLLASWVFLAPSAWQNIISQAITSATYTQNFYLSQQAVDYYALDASTASPLQHFWSLSIQGQVFLIWPLLFILVALVAKKSKHPRRLAFILFSLVFVASLSYSIWFTATNQSAAYFSTAARAWEVALGTLLALALPRIDRALGAARPGQSRSPKQRILRVIAGWSGLVLLLSVGLILDVQGLFPGWVAILPLLAAALIIVAGYSGSKIGFDRILTMKLPRALSSTSYALYLVHWPILVMWLAYSQQARAGIFDGLIVIVSSLLVAWILTKLVDSRFKRPTWKHAAPFRAVTAIAVSLALVFGAAYGWRHYLSEESRIIAEESRSTMTPEVANNPTLQKFNPAFLSPKGYELESQWPDLNFDCDPANGAPEVFSNQIRCESLLAWGSPSDGLIMVVGSSHARQWITAIEQLAAERNYQILNISMDGCYFANNPNIDQHCAPYYDWAMAQITELKPDFVLTNSTISHRTRTSGEVIVPGQAEAFQNVLDTGANIIAIRDNPRWKSNIYHCAESVVRSQADSVAANQLCGENQDQKLAAASPAEDLAELSSATGAKLALWDFTDLICLEQRCDPIQGNAYVYFDDNHLSKVFLRTLQDEAAEKFDQSFGD